jgi:hypothetical protein
METKNTHSDKKMHVDAAARNKFIVGAAVDVKLYE